MANIKTIPAFVDMHVHLREPGFLHKETIETGLKSAIAGGFGAVCSMPNTNPVTDSPDIIKFILEQASKMPGVKVFPVAAVTKNLDSTVLNDFNALKNAGAIAFSNDGLPILDKELFKNALMTGELILSHCEDETNEVKWQIEAFKNVNDLAKLGICAFPRLHFCHISKKESLELIRWAKNEGLPVTAETAPHYFTFTENDVTSNGVYKMNPKLGSSDDKLAVIKALKDGTLDCIATDHAPHTMEEKLAPYCDSPNGIVGLETAFSLALNVLTLDEIVEKMAINPSKILGINLKKEIKVDLDKKWIVDSSKFQSLCKISPYDNMELKGKIIL